MNGRGTDPGPDVLTLGEVVDEVIEAGDGDEVSVGEVLDQFGHRSFGPMILVPGALVATPLSGIPGFGTFCGLIVGLVAGQMVVGKPSPWLPAALKRRRLSRRRLDRAAGPLRRVAGWVDGLLAPRLGRLTRAGFARAIAAICLAIALAMPLLELVPLANSLAGGVIALYGLALVAHDGLLALLALVLTAAAAAAIGLLI